MELDDRARGMMVGIGVGNLLGVPWEGMSKAQIQSSSPGGVRDITTPEACPDDDDLAHAILLAEACNGVDDIDIDGFARSLWDWGELNGLGIGNLTYAVLTLYGGAAPRCGQGAYSYGGGSEVLPRQPTGVPAAEAARLAWEDSGRNSAGNGSVMRCGPVALRWLDDYPRLARNSMLSAVVTHWDPRCIWSTVLADFAIAACLRGEVPEPLSLLERSSRALNESPDLVAKFELPGDPHEDVLDAVRVALNDGAAVEDLELGAGGIGYAPKALGATLWAARHAPSVEEGLMKIVNEGGDTDTNAAPAGAALGARFGLSGIPSRWRTQIANVRLATGTGDGRPVRQPLEWYADLLIKARSLGSCP